MSAIEWLKELPGWLQTLVTLSVIASVFLISPMVKSYNGWRKNKADVRKVETETDLKLIDEYKALLSEFKDTIKTQNEELEKLQADNQRLHDVTNLLVEEAERFHLIMSGCVESMRELGVPTESIPAIPELMAKNNRL